MCGIVGLFCKSAELEPHLGAHLGAMLEQMDDRGPDSAGVAVYRNLVYVLNSGGTGILKGFRIHGHRLRPLSGSARSLGLANTDPPNFLSSPGQVGFTPGGGKLIVTTKASGSKIDTS